MTKRPLLFTIFTVLSTFIASAQLQFPVSPCFHDELINAQTRQTPEFKNVVNKTYEAALRSSNRLQLRDFKVYTIPVVFHVVFKNDTQNISDQRLKDQIQVLNENYRRRNADTGATRAIFKNVAADAGIEFRLDRIIRVKTTATFKPNLLSQTDQIPNQVKKTAQGGSDAIDPDRYLNIWICKIEPFEVLSLQLGQILGFAYPPTGLSNWPDGAAAPSKIWKAFVLIIALLVKQA